MDSTQRTRPRGGGSPVALVVFIILTVLLAAVSYWQFANFKEAERLGTQAQAKQEQAEANLKKALAEKAAMQAAAGAQTDEGLKEFVATALERARELGFGTGANETAADALQVCVRTMEGLRDNNAKLSVVTAQQADQIKAVEEQKNAADVAYKDELAKKLDEIAGLNKKIEDVRAEATAQIDKERTDRLRQQEEYLTAQDAWKDREGMYIVHVAELQQRVRDLSGEGVVLEKEKADGVILSIDLLNKKATVDIGSSGGVKPGMRFVAFTRDAKGAVLQKGVLEVISIAPDVSIAQVIAVAPDQAVGKGDLIYNLAGPEKRLFVFAGDPQKFTLVEWTNVIRANGGDVVAEVQKGSQVADYLVLAQFEEGDPEINAMLRAAQDFGVKILTEAKLQEALGYM